MTAEKIFNLGRAVDGIFPVQTTWNGRPVKLFKIRKGDITSTKNPGYVEYDSEKTLLKVLCSDLQFITVKKIGLVGKKIMSAKDFNNGYVKKEPPDCRYFR